MFIGFLLSIDTQVETWYSNVKKLMKVVEFIWYTVSSIEYWKEKKRKEKHKSGSICLSWVML